MNCVEAVGLEAFIAKKFYCFISIIYLEKIIFDIDIVLFPKRTLQKKEYKRPWNDSVFLFLPLQQLRQEIAKIVISKSLKENSLKPHIQPLLAIQR